MVDVEDSAIWWTGLSGVSANMFIKTVDQGKTFFLVNMALKFQILQKISLSFKFVNSSKALYGFDNGENVSGIEHNFGTSRFQEGIM